MSRRAFWDCQSLQLGRYDGCTFNVELPSLIGQKLTEMKSKVVNKWGVFLTIQGGPLSDDCLVSKKLIPGYCFVKVGQKGLTKTSPWLSRSRVTPASTSLTFRMIKSQHLATRIDNRKRLTRGQVEEKCAVCTLACPLAI